MRKGTREVLLRILVRAGRFLALLAALTGGFSPAVAEAPQSTLSLQTSSSQSVARSGDRLVLRLGAASLGLPESADFNVGAIFPDGINVMTIGGDGVAGLGSTDALSALRPLAASVSLYSPFSVIGVSVEHTWIGTEPSGGYEFFLGADRSGALAQNRLDASDVFAFATAAERTPGASTSTFGAPPLALRPPGGTWMRLTNAEAVFSDVVPEIYRRRGDWGWPIKNIINAWNGGYFDPKRRWMVLPLGGGHNDHGQNETYALDMTRSPLAWRIVIRGSSPLNPDGTNCIPPLINPSLIETYCDGKPVSRHTYGGMTYLRSVDRAFVYGGSYYHGSGSALPTGWLIDVSNVASGYKTMHPGGPAAGYGLSLVEWPKTGEAVFWASDRIVAFDPVKASYRTVFVAARPTIYLSGALDPGRERILYLGISGAYFVDLRANRIIDMTAALRTSVARPLLEVGWPGLSWHEPSQQYIAWAGGSTVYLIGADLKSLTAKTLGGTPPGTALPNGTFGRFAVVPDDSEGVGVLVNGTGSDDADGTYLFNIGL